MRVVAKTHGARNHGVANVGAAKKVCRSNGFSQRYGFFRANIATTSAVIAVCRRVIYAEFAGLKIELA